MLAEDMREACSQEILYKSLNLLTEMVQIGLDECGRPIKKKGSQGTVILAETVVHAQCVIGIQSRRC
jgi:hypothetical protein